MIERLYAWRSMMVAGCLMLGGGMPSVVASQCVEGNGKLLSETRPVGEVSAIDVDGAFEVEIVPGAGGDITVTAETNILPVLVTQASGGKLRITLSQSVCTSRLMRVRVPGGKLREIVAGGANQIDATGLDRDSLSVRLDGSGSARLSGRAQRLELAISGASDIDSRDLKAANVSVKINGAGGASVFAADVLDVTIMGAGNVYYAGRPQVHRNILGVGTISPLN